MNQSISKIKSKKNQKPQLYIGQKLTLLLSNQSNKEKIIFCSQHEDFHLSNGISKTEPNIILPSLSLKKLKTKSIYLKQIPIRKLLPTSVVKKDLNKMIKNPSLVLHKTTYKPIIHKSKGTSIRKNMFVGNLKSTMNKHAKETTTQRSEIKGELTRDIFSTVCSNTAVTKRFTKNYFVDYDFRNKPQDYQPCPNLNLKLSFYDQINFNIKIKQIEDANQKKKIFKEKILRSLISGAAHLKRLDISMKELLILSTVPDIDCQLDYLKAVVAIKENRYDSFVKILGSNRFVVTQVDAFQQTLLHVAAKRNRQFYISYLLLRGARIEAEDSAGRTALHIAALFNHLDNIKILLYEMASPFKKTNRNEYAVQLTTDPIVKFFLQRARALYKFNMTLDMSNTLYRIRCGLKFFFQTPMHDIQRMIGI